MTKNVKCPLVAWRTSDMSDVKDNFFFFFLLALVNANFTASTNIFKQNKCHFYFAKAFYFQGFPILLNSPTRCKCDNLLFSST